MSEFVDFVHQRLEEDEAVARREDDPMTSREDAWTLTGPFDPARVLREVTAKRTILAEHSPESSYSHDADGFEHYFTECKTCGPWADPGDPEKDYPCPTVRALAAPFSDHPDFQEQWR